MDLISGFTCTQPSVYDFDVSSYAPKPMPPCLDSSCSSCSFGVRSIFFVDKE